MEIRCLQLTDFQEWLRLRRELWPDVGPNEEQDAANWLAQADTATFVVVRPGGGLAGFAEFGIRNWAEGCVSGAVAYLEGWYVDADVRHRGIGRALIAAGEAWAIQKNFRELASDAQIENIGAHQAHLAVGFVEMERVVLYRKELGQAGDTEPSEPL